MDRHEHTHTQREVTDCWERLYIYIIPIHK